MKLERKKLVDPEVVAGFLDKLVPFSFPELTVEINNTGLQPEETAKKILTIIQQRDQKQ